MDGLFFDSEPIRAASGPSRRVRECGVDREATSRRRRRRVPPRAVFGTKDKFTKYYEGPILRGREPDATDKQKKLGKARRDLGVLR